MLLLWARVLLLRVRPLRAALARVQSWRHLITKDNVCHAVNP